MSQYLGPAFPTAVKPVHRAPVRSLPPSLGERLRRFRRSRTVNEAESSTTGLRAVGRVYAGWGFSQAFYHEEQFRQLGYPTLDEFLTGFWENNFVSLDPHNLLSMLWTGQHGDISTNAMYDGDFEKALGSIKARAVVMPGATDLYFTPEDSQYETERMPNAIFRPIQSVWGHFAGRGINPKDTTFIDDQLKQLLA